MSNPNIKAGPGRPKGSKDKLSKNVKSRIMQVWDKLEGEGKGLLDEAREKPDWFYANFVKGMIPKDLTVAGDPNNPIKTMMEIVIIDPDGNRTKI